MPKTSTPRTISAKTFCPKWWTTIAFIRTTSLMRTKKRRSTGATLARSRPITKPIWMWFRFRRCSTCTTKPGPFAPTSGSIRRPSLCLKSQDEPARPSIRLFRRAVSFPGAVRYCILSPDVRVNSYTEVDSSILFSHVNVGRHCRIRRAIIDRDVHIPEGTTIGFDPEADRQKYFVTDTGITVVTRDYSLFENPV